MTTETTRNLAREVAEALGWRFEVTDPPFKTDDKYHLLFKPDGTQLFFSHFYGYDEFISEYDLKDLYPDYPNDLNACARDLTREGYKFHAEQLADNLWTGYYTEDEKPFAKLIGWNRSDKLAVAWCESFLALCKHVDGQGGEGR